MKIQRDLTIAGLALRMVNKQAKEVEKLQKQIELLKNDRLGKSQQNFNIRRKKK